MKTLLALVAVVALAGNLIAADEKKKADKPKFTAGSCCDKADKKGEKCPHKCCVEAAKDNKACEKCNKPEKK